MPRRRPAARALPPKPIGGWCLRYFEHRDQLDLDDVRGEYRTHIEPAIHGTGMPNVTADDCRRVRDQLDAL